ncbi:hypothetical protein K502DRAFT_349985 [Neoconidiobolus thromboides FSU 785]|nr:hypothetical protein K502DRAFT_349985 [Neoconidiobolus thromboides FSU 785]
MSKKIKIIEYSIIDNKIKKKRDEPEELKRAKKLELGIIKLEEQMKETIRLLKKLESINVNKGLKTDKGPKNYNNPNLVRLKRYLKWTASKLKSIDKTNEIESINNIIKEYNNIKPGFLFERHYSNTQIYINFNSTPFEEKSEEGDIGVAFTLSEYDIQFNSILKSFNGFNRIFESFISYHSTSLIKYLILKSIAKFLLFLKYSSIS